MTLKELNSSIAVNEILGYVALIEKTKIWGEHVRRF